MTTVMTDDDDDDGDDSAINGPYGLVDGDGAYAASGFWSRYRYPSSSSSVKWVQGHRDPGTLKSKTSKYPSPTVLCTLHVGRPAMITACDPDY
eukprot:CAMPEP_0118965194 /NCGR_PEP_ID=MMETSP1173-20130426/2778_1 /TAXON_ID=1034831 /ORGANISM="Rhizochromulina marina cf, Strain CCMP1243" /LENGTH=92 /DNA_ID=CAMNT_0006913775 /DNA_START=67 /DNA_END=343 /DNA_ORIENTATION=-